MHLVKSADDSLVDAAIGDAGDDPGSAFTICGDKDTKDVTLIRKATVAAGASSWSASAGTSADDCQWTATNEIADIRDGSGNSVDDLDYSSVGNHTFTGSAE